MELRAGARNGIGDPSSVAGTGWVPFKFRLHQPHAISCYNFEVAVGGSNEAEAGIVSGLVSTKVMDLLHSS